MKQVGKILIKYYAVLASIVVFVFYVLTLAPGVIASDSGELATVQYTLGIAHPTGYPLFTILGFIFSHLPIPIRPIIKLNLLSALWSVFTVYVFTITLKYFFDNLKLFLSNHDQDLINYKFNLREECKILVSVFGGLMLGFSRTFWLQSLSVEVYSLHMFLFSLTIYFVLRAYISERMNYETISVKKNWLYAVIFLALGFTNHLTTLYIVPFFLYFYFNGKKIDKDFVYQSIKYFLIALLIIIILYSYLPLRALTQPVVNWGNPVTFEQLINHLSGRLYHQFLFPSFPEFVNKVSFFLSGIFFSFDKSKLTGSEFSIVILFSFIGLLSTIFYMKRFFISFLLLIFTCVFISSLYNIPDIDAYFLAAYYAIAFLGSIGLAYLYSIKIRERIKNFLIPLLFVIGIFIQITFNYNRVDQSDNHVMDDYTLALLKNVEKNAIVVSARSSFYFPSLYYQLVEGVRKDVVIVEHLLSQLNWYHVQLNKIHPGIISFKDSISQINTQGREIYFSNEVVNKTIEKEIKIPDTLNFVPDLFLFKLKPSNEYTPAPDPNYNIRLPEKEIHEKKEIRLIMINMLLNRAIYELNWGRVLRAKAYLEKLIDEFPWYDLPPDLRQILEN